MIVSFLMPLPIRNVEAALLWIFYRQLATLPADQVVYVGSEHYFRDPAAHAAAGRWEVRPESGAHYNYPLPTAEHIAALHKRVIDPAVLGPLRDELPSMNQAWARLLSAEYPPLVAALEDLFREAAKTGSVEAALTWGNCPSLTAAAARFGVPVVHHELGALRTPFYKPAVYFDFRGVNGNTEAADRYRRFRAEIAARPPDGSSRDEIGALVASMPSADPPVEYDLGLALQVENDSNVLVFANGYTNQDLIWTAYQFFPPERVAVRLHPSGYLDYAKVIGPTGHVDTSSTAAEFVRRCGRVATVNSSVGLEAMLLGRPACILGDSPFRFMAVQKLDRLKDAGEDAIAAADAALGFAILGYMVPEPFLFDLDYLRWRLTRPPELAIYHHHRNHLLAQTRKASADAGSA
jgi:hypothetical protein